MNRLNRKEYKKAIKAFRKENPLAGLTHHWVYFHDENNSDVLMYVQWSVVKRLEQLNNDQDIWYRKYHTFDMGGYGVYLELHGPSVSNDCWNVHIDRYLGRSFLVNKDCRYKILNDDDVRQYYDMIFGYARDWNRKYFTELKNKKSGE